MEIEKMTFESIKKMLEKYRKENANLQTVIGNNLHKIERLEVTAENDREKIKGLETTVENDQEKIKELETSIENDREKIKGLETSNAKLISKCKINNAKKGALVEM